MLTPTLFKNSYILKFAHIINVASCIFINNCFNKDSFSILKFQISFNYAFIPRSARNGLLARNLFQVITHSDLEENQLSIQPLLHGIIFKTS